MMQPVMLLTNMVILISGYKQSKLQRAQAANNDISPAERENKTHSLSCA